MEISKTCNCCKKASDDVTTVCNFCFINCFVTTKSQLFKDDRANALFETLEETSEFAVRLELYMIASIIQTLLGTILEGPEAIKELAEETNKFSKKRMEVHNLWK